MDLPIRDKVFVTEHFSSERWNDFPWRDGDIVVSTGMKVGTTWTLRILGLLVHQDLERVDDKVMHAPWPDANFLGPLKDLHKEIEQIKHRRFFKSHLPLDTLPYSPNVKYINVVRHPLDMFRSLLHHWSGISDWFQDVIQNAGHPPFPRLQDQGPVKDVFQRWLTEGRMDWESDGWPFHSKFHVAESFWRFRHLDNVLLLHYSNMLDDLSREVSRIEEFLEIEVDEEMHAEIVRLATFDTMKSQNKAMNPHYDAIFTHGGDGFMRAGGRETWRGILDAEDVTKYEMKAREFDPAFRVWLEYGLLA